MKFCIGLNELQSSNINNIDIVWSQTIANEKERLHHSHFPDSGGPPDFVLPGNAESALLSKIVYRESFPEFKRKYQAFKLNFPLTWTRQSLPQPGKENRMILVESFAIRVPVGVGISLIM